MKPDNSRPAPSLILIGMPGSGKTTLGGLLAGQLSLTFCDTDHLIEISTGESLQQTVDSRGYLYLREVEERVLLDHDFSAQVVATGGSVVYSAPGMAKLADSGLVVFLNVTEPELLTRIGDYRQRGLAKRPDQTFSDLFLERVELYRRYCDVVVDCDAKNAGQVCAEIAGLWGQFLQQGIN